MAESKGSHTDEIYSHFESQLKDLQSHAKAQSLLIKNIESTSDRAVEALRHENERLKQRLQRDWYIPQIAFGAVVTLAGLLFGFNFVDHTWATSDLKDTRTELKDEIQSSLDQIEDTRRQLESTLLDVKSDQQDLVTESNAVLTTSASLIEASIDANAVSSRVLAVCSLARDQLANKGDATSASYYAGEAATELKDAIARLEKASAHENIIAMLKKLQSSVWALQAECSLRNRKLDEVINFASRIVSSKCDCLEGHYFEGIARLAKAVQIGRTATAREELVNLAADALRASASPSNESLNDGFVADLFLAGAELDLGHDEAAWEAVDRFISAHPSDPQYLSRLRGRTRAQVAIALALQRVSAFRLGKDDKLLREDFSCALGAGSIGSVEGLVFERVLERAIEQRSIGDRVIAANEEDWARYQTYLVQVIAGIQEACERQSNSTDSACAGCEPPNVHPVVEKYNLIVMPRKSAGEGKSIASPGGTLQLQKTVIRNELRTRARMEGGVLIEEEYSVRVPVIVTIQVKPGDPIQPDYFVSPPISGRAPTTAEGAPAPPAPTPAEDAPPPPAEAAPSPEA